MQQKTKNYVIVALIISLFILSGCGNSINLFEKQVKNNNYLDAISTYKENILGNSESEKLCRDFLTDYFTTLQSAYIEDTASIEEIQTTIVTISKISNALSIFGTTDIEKNATDWLEEVTLSKTSYSDGIVHAEHGEYAQAITCFNSVSKLDTKNYEDAQNRLNTVTNEYTKIISDLSLEEVDKGNYQVALNIVSEAESIIEKNDLFNPLLAEIYSAYYEDSISSSIASNDAASVFSLYNDATKSEYYAPSPTLIQEVQTYQSDYCNSIIDQSIKAYHSSGYEAALNTLYSSVIKDDKLEKYTRLFKSCIPVRLHDQPLLEGEDRHEDDMIEDLYGNTYEGYHRLVSYKEEYWVSTPRTTMAVRYYLGGQFTNFTATIFGDKEMYDDREISFQVLLDGTEIYNSGYIDRTTKPIPININVENVQELTIQSKGSSSNFGFVPPTVIVAEASLNRVLTDDQLFSVS